MKMKRIYVEVTEEDHRDIKTVASKAGITIKKLIIDSAALYLKHLRQMKELRDENSNDTSQDD